MKRPAGALLLALALCLLTGCAGRNDPNYPSTQELCLLCPWDAGGGIDDCFSSLAQTLEGSLGQRVQIQYTGGGLEGHRAVCKAGNNGYTLGVITTELATYKPLKTGDLTWESCQPLCRLTADPATVTVNAQWALANDITDLPSFLRFCQRCPGQVRMGTSESGSLWHLAGGYLKSAADVDVEVVPFPDSLSAVQNAASGRIQGVTLPPGEVRAFVESGNLVCLGVMGDQPSPIFPAVPTCAQQGCDLIFGLHRGLVLPKGVHGEIQSKLIPACEAAVQAPEFVAFLTANGQTAAWLDSQAYTQFLAREAQSVADAAQVLGLPDPAAP